ncbi:MAG: hypothetical protein ABIP03_09695 [Aquihabitans sp.]
MTEGRWRDPRLAAGAFGLAVVVAVPVILYLNRDQWFFLDEWDFLSTRQLTSPASLLRPHNEHWYTVPIVLYRLVFRLVGLHHYWPYQVLTVSAHLVAAVLIRVVMRRAGVSPWLATVAATVFVYFGTGRENIGWAFQVGFTAPLAFGLVHLLLVDHDGRVDRRDVAGMGFGVLGLMCSSVGVTMVPAVAAAVLLRRGWRPALLHASVLGAVYLTWFGFHGQVASSGSAASPSELARFARNAIEETLRGLGQAPAVGVGLALVLVLGTGLRLARSGDQDARATYAGTAGLMVGAASFIALSGYGRAHLSPEPASRYMYLIAAMVLPAIALAATDIARHWRPATLAVGALLLLGLPGNIGALEPTGVVRYTLGARDPVLVMAATPTPPGSPRSMRPLPLAAPGMTLGWLRDAAAGGRIPHPRPGSMSLQPSMRLAMSIEQVNGDGTPRQCVVKRGDGPITALRGELLRVLASGAAVAGAGPLVGAQMAYYSASVSPQAFDTLDRPEVRLLVVTDRVQLSVRGPEAGTRVLRCAAAL